MSLVVKEKCFSLLDNISCFSDLAVLRLGSILYEILRLGSVYNKIDAVFDRYFDRSLKEATLISGGNATKLSKSLNSQRFQRILTVFYTSARIKMIEMSILLKDLL